MLSAMLVEWQLKLRDRHRVRCFGDEAEPSLTVRSSKARQRFSVLS
jgi:hypothetical protein